MVNNSTNLVEPCMLSLWVKQLDAKTNKFERVGDVELNLSEFLSSNETSRICLLHNSKMNSSLMLTIRTRQFSGDPMYRW